jgi:eukaryotic-like serine/threonine-protein kinase
MKCCPTCYVCFDDEVTSCPRQGHAPLAYERAGTRLLAGKYRLEYLLGKGGMGAVYAATQLRLKRLTAVKLLQMGVILEEARRANPDLGKNPQALERLRRHTLRRFAQEARAAARLNHPNVVNIHEYDLLPTGEAYISMELLEGETLQEYVGASTSRKLPVEAAVAIIRQVAAGVRAGGSRSSPTTRRSGTGWRRRWTRCARSKTSPP